MWERKRKIPSPAPKPEPLLVVRAGPWLPAQAWHLGSWLNSLGWSSSRVGDQQSLVLSVQRTPRREGGALGPAFFPCGPSLFLPPVNSRTFIIPAVLVSSVRRERTQHVGGETILKISNSSGLCAVGSQQHSGTQYPSASQHPSGTQYPSASQHPSGTQYPSASQHPSGTQYLSASQHPSAFRSCLWDALQMLCDPWGESWSTKRSLGI